jgi:hypothetical protein
MHGSVVAFAGSLSAKNGVSCNIVFSPSIGSFSVNNGCGCSLVGCSSNGTAAASDCATSCPATVAPPTSSVIASFAGASVSPLSSITSPVIGNKSGALAREREGTTCTGRSASKIVAWGSVTGRVLCAWYISVKALREEILVKISSSESCTRSFATASDSKLCSEVIAPATAFPHI